MIHHGDCLDVMAAMEPESIDAVVCDPPYGLAFMGKEWDRLDGAMSKPGIGDRPIAWPSYGDDFAGYNPTCAACGGRLRGAKKCSCAEPDWRIKGKSFVERKSVSASGGWDAMGGNHHPTSQADVHRTALAQGRRMQTWHEAWAREAFRVAKPGAYLLAFGGTRTVHRMTCAIEDAGWIIRDMLVWGYASGFPKGRANLKPAWEPIVMARKPGPLRPLAIDGCRIPFTGDETPDDREGEPTAATRYTLDGGTNLAAKPGRRIKSDRASAFPGGKLTSHGSGSLAGPGAAQETSRTEFAAEPSAAGRWPANVLLTSPIFDGDVPGVVGGGEGRSSGEYARSFDGPKDGPASIPLTGGMTQYGDSGTYSRFFLIPKAARSDREPVLGGHGLATRRIAQYNAMGDEPPDGIDGLSASFTTKTQRANVHPTVKPTDLMRHLVRLVTPPGGIVLDPFLGSGTTALAAEMEGFAWVGIEREAEYVAIAEARLNGTQRGMAL